MIGTLAILAPAHTKETTPFILAPAGAPCASGTVCRPARADTTLGFCLPDNWGTTINKAGAGSSSGGVTGAWTGGLQGPNGAGLYTGGQPPPPSPPSRTPSSTLRPVRAVTRSRILACCVLASTREFALHCGRTCVPCTMHV